MRRFGGERVTNLLNRFTSADEQGEIRLEMRMLTKQIETAQKRVEAMNFETRKNVLRYDDVMNKQREIIYGQRRRVLMGEDLLREHQDHDLRHHRQHRGTKVQPACAKGELGSHRAFAGDLQAHAHARQTADLRGRAQEANL